MTGPKRGKDGRFIPSAGQGTKNPASDFNKKAGGGKKKRRRVTMDSSVLLSNFISNRRNTVSKKAVRKAVEEDRVMLTDIIAEECLKYAGREDARLTEEQIERKLKRISPHIISVSYIPPPDKLRKRYEIRDENDLKILYSADRTRSVILVTLDKDFIDAKGQRAQIKNPWEYLDDKGDKKKNSKRRQRR